MIRRTLLTLLAASPAFAAGFGIDVQSGRGTAMAGAVTALVDDASANFYNPAGLAAGGRGFEVMVGDTLILPQISYTSPSNVSTSTSFVATPPPHAYARVGLFDSLALGIGFFVPYGAAVQWPDAWAGQFLAQSSQLQTYDINMNLAFRPHPRISLAAGLDVLRGTVYISRNINFVDTTGSVALGGGAWGVGYNAGVQFEAIENVMYFGATLRGSVPMDFTGNAHFEGVPPSFQSQIYDQAIKASVTLPMTASFGLGFRVMSRLRVEADVSYVNWSAFHDLTIQFSKSDALTVPQPKQWWDTAAFHIGAEFDVTPAIAARLGFMVDPTPSPGTTLTPDLPDATRLNFALGVGYQHSSGFKADLGFQFVALLSQASTATGFAGTYSGTAEVISLSLGWKMAPKPKAVEAEPAGVTPPAEGPLPSSTPN
jgi:long-chain fatty acid transport protein